MHVLGLCVDMLHTYCVIHIGGTTPHKVCTAAWVILHVQHPFRVSANSVGYYKIMCHAHIGRGTCMLDAYNPIYNSDARERKKVNNYMGPVAEQEGGLLCMTLEQCIHRTGL
jgi:hypothetical protein